MPETRETVATVPWCGWNSFVHISGPRPSPPVSPYRVLVRLAPGSDNCSVIPEPINDPQQYVQGDSRFRNQSASGFDFGMSIDSIGLLEYKCHSNLAGRLSGIEIAVTEATNLENALYKGMTLYHYLALNLCAATQIPVNFAAVLTVAANGLWLATVRADSPVVDFDAAGVSANPAIRLLVPIYLEGLRTASPFYALLSFFKIGEFLGKEHGHKLRKAREQYGLPPSKERPRIPDDPFRLIAPQFVGRKVLDVLGEIEHDYRNNIGHLISADPLMPSTFTGEETLRGIAVVAR